MQIAPINDEDWPTELAYLLPGFAGKLNVYRTMAHHPALLRAWANLREHIVNQSSLPKDFLEVVILRAGHNLNSPYEWAHHVFRSRQLGMADARITSIQGEVENMEDRDGLLAKAVDELFQTAQLCPQTQSALIATFSLPAMFDLMATVGFYSTLGFILNSFDTPLDDNVRAALDAWPD
ncbi:MAG: carboxymuconolactone decarboxylase family protein [Paracoccaceae bacterium]